MSKGSAGFPALAGEPPDRRKSQSGDAFPGSVAVRDGTITFTIRRSALGAPRAYALAATAERTYYPGGRGDPEVDSSVDHAPDQQWPRPNPRWVEVGGV